MLNSPAISGTGVYRRDVGPCPHAHRRRSSNITAAPILSRPALSTIELGIHTPSRHRGLPAAASAAGSPCYSSAACCSAGRHPTCNCIKCTRQAATTAIAVASSATVAASGLRCYRSWTHAAPYPAQGFPSPSRGLGSHRSRRTRTRGAAVAPGAAEGGEVSSAPNPSGPVAAATAALASASAAASRAAATSTVDADEIARRIAASRARRAASRLSYNCPACSISAATPANIARHMARCCPDLMEPDATGWARLEALQGGFPSPQHDAVVALLRAAGGREQELRRRVLACVFLSGPVDEETGLPSRLEAEEAARRLGLPLARAASLLQRAMASVPLASDSDGPPLEVVFEDEHFLAVNKPVGLHTAPIHRFTGGSVVNKVIAYLNRGRGRGARSGAGDGTQVTLLNPSLGAGGAAGPSLYGSAIPELMPLPEPFTLTPPSTPSVSSASDSENDASDGGGAAAAGGSSRTASYQLEPYVLHRLDMNTSGLLLFAKRPEVVAGIHRQFRERTLSKLYVAAAVGCPDCGDGVGVGVGGGSSRFQFRVDAAIDRHPTQAVARMVADTGKEASTNFAVLASNPAADLGPAAGGSPGLLFHERPQPHQPRERLQPRPQPGPTAAGGPDAVAAPSCPGAIPRGASLLLCAPHTGRTHQIRVHLHQAGHPIVGDDIYGITGPWLTRQALHAAALRFTHPLTGRRVTLAAPLHDDMAAALAALGLPQPEVAALAALAEAEWPGGGAGGQAGARAGGGGRRRR